MWLQMQQIYSPASKWQEITITWKVYVDRG